jgi:PAS domain S-box-containing protein
LTYLKAGYHYKREKSTGVLHKGWTAVMEKDLTIKQKQNEQRFRMLLESVPDALIFAFHDGTIIMVNREAEELFGYSRAEMLGREVQMLMPERYRNRHRNFIAEYFRNPRHRSMGAGLDLYGLTKDGREFPVDISLSPVESDEGLFVIADIRDISSRKQAEENIKRVYHYQSTISAILRISLEPVSLEVQLERILDTILSLPWLTQLAMGSIYLIEDDPDMLVMKAQRGLPETIKSACAAVPVGSCLCGLGASTREIVFADCIDERHKEKYEADFLHGHYCAPVISGEKVLGVLNLYLKDRHIRNPEEEKLISSITNTIAGVIERKRIELEKEELQEQLIQSEKMSALGRVTANVAHDIRNPLTVIGGFMRRLNKIIPPGSKEKEYAAIITSEVIRLEKILKNVLTYSRQTALDKERHDVNDIVYDFIRTYEIICKEHSIKIETALSDLPQIMVDIDRASEAINNVLANAIEAMPDGGVLTVATRKEDVEGKTYLAVMITDTGEGIPEVALKNIFEPFYSSKIAGHGAGLGLSISKKIMEEHGGFIRVESTVGKGSTFGLYFPF